MLDGLSSCGRGPVAKQRAMVTVRRDVRRRRSKQGAVFKVAEGWESSIDLEEEDGGCLWKTIIDNECCVGLSKMAVGEV